FKVSGKAGLVGRVIVEAGPSDRSGALTFFLQTMLGATVVTVAVTGPALVVPPAKWQLAVTFAVLVTEPGVAAAVIVTSMVLAAPGLSVPTLHDGLESLSSVIVTLSRVSRPVLVTT